MLTQKQKRQVRLLCRQHAKMEAEGMKVQSYPAFHGMNAFLWDEWDSAVEENGIPALFTEKFSRLCDQHSETCWSDSPIGPFGLMGEVDGLRSLTDLWSRPILGCDPRVNGLRTVRPSKLKLAIKLKNKDHPFGHSEILVNKSRNIKFWIKKKAIWGHDASNYIEQIIANNNTETENVIDVIKAYAYRNMVCDCNNDRDIEIITAVIEQAKLNGLKVVTIDDDGVVTKSSSISSMEDVEEYLNEVYGHVMVEKVIEATKANLFQRFLEDGSNAKFASICCPAWAKKETDLIYEGLVEYKDNAYGIFPYWRADLDCFYGRIDGVIECMEEYAKDSMDKILPMINKARGLINEIAEEMEADEDLPF